MENYGLPINYNFRFNNHYFDDTPYKDEYQNDVYDEASKLSNKHNFKTILDIGMGSGFKLLKYFNHLDTIGIDLQPTVDFLIKKYPERKWSTIELLDKNIEYDLIICSDVIEHVRNPIDFINMLNLISFKKIVFSTPDKLNMYGCVHFGPPSNSSHVMEWDMAEFNSFIGEYYNIERHFKSDEKSNTQIIICEKK